MRRRRSAVVGSLCSHCEKVLPPVHIRCASPLCQSLRICVDCFSVGAADLLPHTSDHPYSVVNSQECYPFSADWSADDELNLLRALSEHGPNHWTAVANAVGKTATKCQKHYEAVYLQSPSAPLPSPVANDHDLDSVEAPSDDEKSVPEQDSADALETPDGREKHKTPQKNAFSLTFIPFRGDFEFDFDESAEEQIGDISVSPDDSEEEINLKLRMLEVYNARLDRRIAVKEYLFGNNLLENASPTDGNQPKPLERKELDLRLRIFSSFMTEDDFESFHTAVLTEYSRLRDIHRKARRRKRDPKTPRHVPLCGSRAKGSAKQTARKREKPERGTPAKPTNGLVRLNCPPSPSEPTTPLPISPAPPPSEDGTVPENNDESIEDNAEEEVNGRDIASKIEEVTCTSEKSPFPVREGMPLDGLEHEDRLTDRERKLCSALHIEPKNFLKMREKAYEEVLASEQKNSRKRRGTQPRSVGRPPKRRRKPNANASSTPVKLLPQNKNHPRGLLKRFTKGALTIGQAANLGLFADPNLPTNHIPSSSILTNPDEQPSPASGAAPNSSRRRKKRIDPSDSESASKLEAAPQPPKRKRGRPPGRSKGRAALLAKENSERLPLRNTRRRRNGVVSSRRTSTRRSVKVALDLYSLDSPDTSRDPRQQPSSSAGGEGKPVICRLRLRPENRSKDHIARSLFGSGDSNILTRSELKKMAITTKLTDANVESNILHTNIERRPNELTANSDMDGARKSEKHPLAQRESSQYSEEVLDEGSASVNHTPTPSSNNRRKYEDSSALVGQGKIHDTSNVTSEPLKHKPTQPASILRIGNVPGLALALKAKRKLLTDEEATTLPGSSSGRLEERSSSEEDIKRIMKSEKAFSPEEPVQVEMVDGLKLLVDTATMSSEKAELEPSLLNYSKAIERGDNQAMVPDATSNMMKSGEPSTGQHDSDEKDERTFVHSGDLDESDEGFVVVLPTEKAKKSEEIILSGTNTPKDTKSKIELAKCESNVVGSLSCEKAHSNGRVQIITYDGQDSSTPTNSPDTPKTRSDPKKKVKRKRKGGLFGDVTFETLAEGNLEEDRKKLKNGTFLDEGFLGFRRNSDDTPKSLFKIVPVVENIDKTYSPLGYQSDDEDDEAAEASDSHDDDSYEPEIRRKSSRKRKSKVATPTPSRRSSRVQKRTRRYLDSPETEGRPSKRTRTSQKERVLVDCSSDSDEGEVHIRRFRKSCYENNLEENEQNSSDLRRSSRQRSSSSMQ